MLPMRKPYPCSPFAIYTDDATGYTCAFRTNAFGVYCGYVGVPKTHPAHGLRYYTPWNDDAPPPSEIAVAVENIEVHGGLTFAGCFNHEVADFDPELWLFGFDCGHLGDGIPLLPAFSMGPLEPATYKDAAYTRAEITKLARQLKAIEDGYAEA